MTGDTKIPIKTTAYIDVSNIRWACQYGCGFSIDFVKLYKYLVKKFPGIEIRYYEGISRNDSNKHKEFVRLSKTGYKICSLSRKSYTEPPRRKLFRCKKCDFQNEVEISRKRVKLKSNVDVYLATDAVANAALHSEKQNILIFSCDGDYTEAIENIIKVNQLVHVFVYATSKTKRNNCLSQRLKDLTQRIDKTNYSLVDITTIMDYIS